MSQSLSLPIFVSPELWLPHTPENAVPEDTQGLAPELTS